jgi:hypothetical protein
MYNDLLKVTISYEQTNLAILNNNLIYRNHKINIREKTIVYDCLIINDELLKVKFPDLTLAERQLILENNGTPLSLNQINRLKNPQYNDILLQSYETPIYYVINKNQWIYFMTNISMNQQNNIYSNFAFKFASYYPYIDFNLYTSMIGQPNIKLICEYIYFDDVERAKFANSKLEYVIEIFNQDIYNINNMDMFNCELSY